MTDLELMEREVADAVYAAMQMYTTRDERSTQASNYQVGISDLGWCSERTRRMLAQEDPEDTDMLTAFLGTAIGKDVESAVSAYGWDTALIQSTVELVLESQTHTYTVPGHPDIVLPHGVVIDVKTSRGLTLPAKSGFTEQQKKFQRHGYGKAAFDSGLFNPEVTLDDVVVGNVWIDRSGDDKEVLVRLERFDPTVIGDMTEWLEEVIYAFTHNEQARKEPPREMCAKTCGFFATCRAFDTDTVGLLTDEVTLEAIAQYREGLELEKAGARLKDQAKAHLIDTDGFALVGGERFALRWTHVNESLVPEYTRKGYDKIDLRKVK